MANKFKVGDRVRVLHTDYKEDIPVGTITHIVHIEDNGDADLWCETYPYGLRFYASEFELAPKFSVGDRVVLVKDGTSTKGAVGKLATINSWDGKLMDGGDYLLKIDPPYDYTTVSVSPEYTRAKPDCIVSASPSGTNTLRIEAGKYYRTRDGRKVGPMAVWGHGIWHAPQAEKPFDGGLWLDDGKGKYRFVPGSPDLIAEWVDEEPKRYSSCEAAQVDVQREEYGAPAIFKDGVITFGTFVVDGHTKRPAIVALIDNGQPKTSERPHVHADIKAATAEAERLAGKHPGKEFGVYELVATRKEEPKHEWQKLALAGKVDEATEALVEAAGVDRWSAQNAIQMMRAA